MSRVLPADESRNESVKAMGEPLGSLYHELWQEVARLYRKWHEYVELFGSKSSRVELLNKAASTFFRIVQDSLWEETLLHIARLSDPPKSAGRPNLTLQRLPPLIDDKETAAAVRRLIEKMCVATEFCKDWRNRRIAHRDLDFVLSKGAIPLKPASREKVKIALIAIVEILNAVECHYRKTTTFFDGIGSVAGGATSLLYVLDSGIKAESEKRERLRQGHPLASDRHRGDL